MFQRASVMDNAAQQTKMCSKPGCIVSCDNTAVHVSSMPCDQTGPVPAMVHALFVKCKVKVQYMTEDVTAAAWTIIVAYASGETSA